MFDSVLNPGKSDCLLMLKFQQTAFLFGFTFHIDLFGKFFTSETQTRTMFKKCAVSYDHLTWFKSCKK